MKLHEYLEASRRTIPTDLDHNTSLAVVALGLCGEVGELSAAIDRQADVAEELGDIMWYVAYGYAVICTDIGAVPGPDIVYRPGGIPSGDICAPLHLATSTLADHIKKVIGQGHILNRQLVQVSLVHITDLVYSVCDGKIDFEDVLEANVSKLQSRYPDGFDPARSRERT